MKQGNSSIQVQKLEQRQTTSAQQILAARLTELTVEELCARIKAECEENPWLESSVSGEGSDYGGGGEMADSGGVDTPESEGREDSELNGDLETYAPDASMETERDDDFPQPQQNGQEEGRTGRDNGEELSFHDVLMQQMMEYDLTEHQQVIMEYLIGSLDPDGLLRIPLAQLADELDIYRDLPTNEREVEHVLGILQQFDPWGVGARNLCECLLIQVKRNTRLPMRSQLIRLLTEYSDELMLSHWDQIQKRMKLTNAELSVMRNSIRRLNPRPGGSVGATPVGANHQIVPDFVVTIDEVGGLHFHLNEQNVPIVTLADDYTEDSALQLAGISNEKLRQEVMAAQKFQKMRMDEGRQFIEALAIRRHSMLVTMGAILRLQKDFFLEGDENMLRPMILEDVATLAKLDISTVSRVCRSKSVDTPHGVFSLSWFFTTGVEKDGETLSVRHIMKALQEIVAGEDKRKPYSDEALTQLLKQRGYQVARRTVAKYRIQMGIPDSRLRR